LCVNCFAKGVELETHLSSHSYHIHNKLNFPLFAPDWTAEEELLLFDGIDQFGFGSWKDISDFIYTKSKGEVEKHFEEVYFKKEISSSLVTLLI